MTSKQANRALAALTNLQAQRELYAEIADIRPHQYQWEREALFRLRAHLIQMLDENDLAQWATADPPP